MSAIRHNGRWYRYFAAVISPPLTKHPGMADAPTPEPNPDKFLGIWQDVETGRGGAITAPTPLKAEELAREVILNLPAPE